RIASSYEFDLALGFGVAGGWAVTLFALAIARLAPRAPRERPPDVPAGPPSRRGWMAAAALAAGVGGAALLTSVALYLAVGGHVPGMIGAVLGAALAALAARAARVGQPTFVVPDPTIARQVAWVRSMAPPTMVRATDLYLLFLFSTVGTALIAYVPSEIRLVQPNAVLFPFAALSVVFVAGLLALPFAVGDDRPSGSLRRVAEIGPAAFGAVGLLALVPPYLPGGRGLFFGCLVGLLGGTVVVLAEKLRRPRPGLERTPRRVARVAGVGFWSAAIVLGALSLSNGDGLVAVASAAPTVGLYGLGLASVSVSGLFGGFVALDLGGRFSASLDPWGEAGAIPSVAPVGFPVGVRLGLALAAGLGGAVLVGGFLFLVPLEAGVAPGSLLAVAGITEPRVLLGGAGGVALAFVWWFLDRAGSNARTAHVLPERLGWVATAAPLLLAVVVPMVVGDGLGGAMLVGLLGGAAAGAMGLEAFGAPGAHGESVRSSPSPLLPALALTLLIAVAWGAVLLSRSFSGAF
ncbi:MAG: hypothetical protein L3J91_01495, partial [Thermoplasmata archaeon]|nr:hypothetical protein [Thermoplasmata archaeon]